MSSNLLGLWTQRLHESSSDFLLCSWWVRAIMSYTGEALSHECKVKHLLKRLMLLLFDWHEQSSSFPPKTTRGSLSIQLRRQNLDRSIVSCALVYKAAQLSLCVLMLFSFVAPTRFECTTHKKITEFSSIFNKHSCSSLKSLKSRTSGFQPSRCVVTF